MEGEIRRYGKDIVGMVENESNVCSTSSQAYAADQSSCAAVYTRQLPFPLCFSYKITYIFFFLFFTYIGCAYY